MAALERGHSAFRAYGSPGLPPGDDSEIEGSIARHFNLFAGSTVRDAGL